jgi:vacuolar protein sorting-associated protein 13A/C
MLGDIMVPGAEPPLRPVRMYRDAPSTESGTSATQLLALPDAPGEQPRLAPPQGYALVYRDSAAPALTLWRPIPRRGYITLGCVLWPAIEEPPLGLVRCARRDLVAAARFHESPLWVGASTDIPLWRASIWPVDNDCQTFIGVKGEGRPQRGCVALIY